MKYRSRFEGTVAAMLSKTGVTWDYEKLAVKYDDVLRGSSCTACGGTDIVKSRVYTPDFVIYTSPSKQEIRLILEVKGRFLGSDRTKILSVLATPRNCITRENFRIVFMYDNWLTNRKKVRYSGWCERNEIMYSVGKLGTGWFK